MKISIFLLIALTAFNALGSVTVTKSEISFTAIGKPAFIKATGMMLFKSSTLKVENNQLSGTILVDINKLNTGIDLRDEHLKEKYLHVTQYPEAKLEIQEIDLVEGTQNKNVTATLYFHGKTKQLTIPLMVIKNKNQLKVSSDFELLLSDFGVELPSFQGITAANKVSLKVNSEIEIK